MLENIERRDVLIGKKAAFPHSRSRRGGGGILIGKLVAAGVHLPPALALGVAWVPFDQMAQRKHPRPHRESARAGPPLRPNAIGKTRESEKIRNRPPPKVFRLKQRPIVC